MWGFIVFGAFILLPGLLSLWVALRSKKPENLVTVHAELARSVLSKNVQTKYGLYRNVTNYTYLYVVNGKKYRARGVRLTHRRNIPKRITVVYLRGLPWLCSYENFPTDVFLLIATLFSLIGLLMISLPFWVGK